MLELIIALNGLAIVLVLSSIRQQLTRIADALEDDEPHVHVDPADYTGITDMMRGADGTSKTATEIAAEADALEKKNKPDIKK